MGVVGDLIARANHRKQALKEYEEKDRIVETVSQRKMSHNERVLLKSLEEERQELIKEALYWDNRKRMALEKLKAHNMMKFNPEFFNNSSILNEKNRFLNGGNF